LDLAPLFLEICRLKVGILYEKFTKKFEYCKITRVFCLLRGSKFQKVKELNRIFYLILKENGLIYENQLNIGQGTLIFDKINQILKALRFIQGKLISKSKHQS
jgi:hypothetical protein